MCVCVCDTNVLVYSCDKVGRFTLLCFTQIAFYARMYVCVCPTVCVCVLKLMRTPFRRSYFVCQLFFFLFFACVGKQLGQTAAKNLAPPRTNFPNVAQIGILIIHC